MGLIIIDKEGVTKGCNEVAKFTKCCFFNKPVSLDFFKDGQR